MSFSKDSRPPWFLTFLTVAETFAERSTCPRLATGAVIVSPDMQILSAGYNGAPRGMDHCFEKGCQMEDGHCIRAVHAEMNAIVQAARIGVSLKGATMFCTHSPCKICTKLIIQSGIEDVFFAEWYGSQSTQEFMIRHFRECRIQSAHYDMAFFRAAHTGMLAADRAAEVRGGST